MRNVLRAGRPPQLASQRWKAFALLVVTYFITIVDFTIVNVALPTIGRELRFPESDLQWLVTAYGLTFAGFLLLGGRAADLLGRRRLLMAGLVGLHRRLPGWRPGHLGHLPHRDARDPGTRGGARAAGCAVDRDEHVLRGRRAQQGPRHLGRGGRTGRDGRPAGRRNSHHLRRMAVHLLLQRPHRRSGARPWRPTVVPGNEQSRVRSGPRRYDPFGAVSITAALLVLRLRHLPGAPGRAGRPPRPSRCSPPARSCSPLFLVIETKVEAPLLPLPLLPRARRRPDRTRSASCSGRASSPSCSWAPSTCSRCSASRRWRPGRPG